MKILVLTTFETDELVVSALRAGASGYLGKGVDPGALLPNSSSSRTKTAWLCPAATTADRSVEPGRLSQVGWIYQVTGSWCTPYTDPSCLNGISANPAAAVNVGMRR